MSWMKRRSPAAPNTTTPPVQMYNPNQHQDQWSQSNTWFNQQTNEYQSMQLQQQHQQQQQQQQQQQPQQHSNYWEQQGYQDPQANSLYYQNQQHSGYYQQNSTYNQPEFNMFNNQQQQQPQQQQPKEEDAWNWGWGDEDNSNVNTEAVQQTVQSSNDNAPAAIDALVNEEPWNWNVEESATTASSTSNIAGTSNEEEPDHTVFAKVGDANKHRRNSIKPEDFDSGEKKTIKTEWSTESQESSDDVLQTSESLMSRSSTVSHSPLSGQHTPMEVLPPPPIASAKQEPYENSEILAKATASPPLPVKAELKTEPALPPPPKNITPPLDNNPFKRNSGPISHKSINKPTAAPTVPVTDRQFPFNLETVPDNSEQPDVPQLAVAPKPTAKPPVPDNNEVAPINERDQYLETGHLSDETIRMVLGQEPPPPGLSRMVLGQNSSRPLQRMVPGESSSPETTSNYIAPPAEPDDDESENEELDRLSASQQLPRSATIGADTPTPPTTGGAGDGGNESHDGGAIEELASSVKDLSVADEAPRVTTDSDRERKDSSPHRRRYRGDKRYEEDDERDRRDRDRRRYKENPDQVYKERRYDDDTEDYYTDRDRHRDDSRSYGSLRREKDRRRRDYRDYRERDRRDYYYGRYDESYDEDLQRSRPTSRSDSMHDSTYSRDNRRPKHRGVDRDRERERDSRRPPRQPHADSYSHYMQNYNPYDPYNPYYQQYKYWEHLRQTNPKAYSEFYQQYMLQQGMAKGMPPVYGGGVDDRNSVHSGRSSTNDDLAKERYSQQRQRYYEHSMYYRDHQPRSISGHYGLDDSSASRPFDYTDSSLNLDTTMSYGGVSEDQQQQRLTPAKFSSAHVCASISGGKLVKILPNYPMDGQPAMVEINRIEDFLPGDEELREFLDFPGPLVKGVTHKKTVIEYCESKIRSIEGGYGSDDAYTLMWELLVLLLRQNGRVDGADIAELLMKDKRLDYNRRASSVVSNESSVGANEAGSQSGSEIKEEIVTNKFREYLLYGSEKEALEWAMKHGLWGHALFLASKLDKRTYANVMMRFANGLPMNDPLQTLYQLLSGRLPASVTSVQDEKWGDWRPHLAMILSNTTQRPELHRKAITTLADTLMSRGSLYAAQFCYLMAEVGFSRYGSDGAKLVLLGSDHTCRPFHSFATNDAIHMTEVYEYARSLSDANFIIPEFQAYKYLLATRLADRGFLETALSYLERVSMSIIQNPANSQPTLINRVCEMANRLKYNDPVSDEDLVEDLDVNRPDSSWLQDLKVVQNQYSLGLITHDSLANLNIGTPDMEQHEQSNLNHAEDDWNQQPDVVDQPQYGEQQQQWPPQEQQEYIHQQQQPVPDQGGFSGQYNQWNHQQHSYSQPEMQSTVQPVEDPQQHHADYWQPAQNEDVQPQISMPNQSNSLPYGEEDYNESTPTPQKQASPEKKAAQPTPKKAPAKQASNGWFGGIFKGILRPKNQMKLPDDKNPSIVWDQEKKRWINMDEDGNETVSELKPPPKMSEMQMNGANKAMTQPPRIPEPVQSQPVMNQQPMVMNQQPNIQQTIQQQPQPPTQPTNMFKLQRNRNLKKSYVDVFNPDGKATVPPSIMPPDPYAPPTVQSSNLNFFVPAPMADPNAPMDFLTPTTMMTQATDSQTMSRWSSASSLSREVQYYMQAKNIPSHIAYASKPAGGAVGF
ncbi:PREDICTED: protein transport protein Sec16A isoform X2 [Nicrophorus vespilloides]|uniref:Protein transport protein sec16 n=1 Tax=Nicrophorus vespilloides TaxID=110193 RepID=A0ABM1NAW5_NICVS|nr:PREDICTED: protein transport protein Sec16A isoform X2 [Nicrophorus vespilloides]